MRKILISTFALMFLSDVAFSQTRKKKRRKKAQKKQPTEEVVAEPKATKESKNFPKIELYGGAGWGIYPLLGFSGGMGYSTSPTSIWEAGALVGSGKIDYVGFSYMAAEFRWKKFWLGPVYTAQGLAYRTVQGKYNVYTDASKSTEAEATSTTTSLCATLALGTHFRFGTLGLGGDIGGVMFQVASLGREDKLPATFDQTDADAQKATYEKVGGAMTLQVARLYLSLHF